MGKIAVGLVGQVTVNGEKSHHFCCSLHLFCLVPTATADEEPKTTCEHPEIPTTAYKHNPPPAQLMKLQPDLQYSGRLPTLA